MTHLSAKIIFRYHSLDFSTIFAGSPTTTNPHSTIVINLQFFYPILTDTYKNTIFVAHRNFRSDRASILLMFKHLQHLHVANCSRRQKCYCETSFNWFHKSETTLTSHKTYNLSGFIKVKPVLNCNFIL
jgi:hypothetical protein